MLLKIFMTSLNCAIVPPGAATKIPKWQQDDVTIGISGAQAVGHVVPSGPGSLCGGGDSPQHWH